MNIVIFVEIGNGQIKWEDCSENEKKDIELALNKQGLSALGYFYKEL